MFGINKGKIVEETVLISHDLPKPIALRNDEVTVQITPSKGSFVNTAMATHIGTREYQQDAAYVSDVLFGGAIVFGVLCDGMGGMAEGERASSDVVSFMANQISSMPPEQDIPVFFQACAAKANEMVLEENMKTRQESGTTLVAVIVRNDELYWLNVGDSRLYISRGGEIVQVSRDHNFALELQERVDAGQIAQQQADADPRKEALISYIGAPTLERVDVNQSCFKLKDKDIVLLCSDGLTKIMSDDEILAVVCGYDGSLVDCAKALPLAAFDAATGGMDNTSVILMQYNFIAQ